TMCEGARHRTPDGAQPQDADALCRGDHRRHRNNRAARNQGKGVLSFGAMARGISAARAARLREPLERLYRRYDYDARAGSDAIQFPARYQDPLDREIVALLAACLAYGRVSLFGPWVVRLLDWLGPYPRAFVDAFDPARDGPRFAPFHYR